MIMEIENIRKILEQMKDYKVPFFLIDKIKEHLSSLEAKFISEYHREKNKMILLDSE